MKWLRRILKPETAEPSLFYVVKHHIFGWIERGSDLSDGEAILLGYKQIRQFSPTEVMGPSLSGSYAVRRPCDCCKKEVVA